MNKSKYLIVLFILILLFSECKIRNLVSFSTKIKNSPDLIEANSRNILSYKSLTIKIEGKYSGNKQKMSFGGQIRIKKDSLIWFSLTPGLGIEIVRGLLTTDSVFILNRFENSYMKGNYNDLEKIAGAKLTFNDLQCILTNVPFLYLKTDSESKELEK